MLIVMLVVVKCLLRVNVSSMCVVVVWVVMVMVLYLDVVGVLKFGRFILVWLIMNGRVLINRMCVWLLCFSNGNKV